MTAILERLDHVASAYLPDGHLERLRQRLSEAQITDLVREAESAAAIGVFFFDECRRLQQDLYHSTAENHAWSIFARELARLYRTWKEYTEKWLDALASLGTHGRHIDVELEGKLRERYAELAQVNLDVDDLFERYARLDSGEGQNLEEFFRGLSHSHQP